MTSTPATVEILGNPGALRYPSSPYARNVWDLACFGGRLYVGQGDSGSNQGPVDVMSIDLESGAIAPEKRIPQQQIERFVELAGTFYIPGHDPMAKRTSNTGPSYLLEALYRLGAAGWAWCTKLGWFEHLYALTELEGGLLAGLGSYPDRCLAWSGDGGKSWSYPRVSPGEGLKAFYPYRVHELFRLGGQLYASGHAVAYTRTGQRRNSHLMRIDSAGQATGLPWDIADALFPGLAIANSTLATDNIRIVRPIEFGGCLVYGAGLRYRDHMWEPKGLFVASSLADARRIEIGGDVWDIAAAGGRLYVLADEAGQAVIHASADLASWERVCELDLPTFARSLEVAGGSFYLGLGCRAEAPHAASGEVWQVTPALVEERAPVCPCCGQVIQA